MHETTRTSEYRSRKCTCISVNAPLEYMQICVYYNPDTDTRNQYSCQCERTLSDC